VRGEGTGAIFLKRLSQAQADGDHVYAIVKATAENHGGRVTTLTAPNGAAQTELLVEAYEKAAIDPATVGYIECHGTGSSLGDSIEVQALSRAFAELYKRHGRTTPAKPHCGLSSLKSNIGHLETAAGIAGIIKILLAMQHRQIPATLHFRELNPYIDLKGTPFHIVDKTTPWESLHDRDGVALPRRAGISSFGFGGANAHIVLEEYIPPQPRRANGAPAPRLIVLSAKNGERLTAYANSLLEYVERDEVDLTSLAYTLQVGRDAFAERLAFVAADRDEVIKKLTEFLSPRSSVEGVYRSDPAKKQAARLDNGRHPSGAEGALEDLMACGDLAGLAALWTNGADIDWQLLYQSGRPARVPLPTYPFAKDRYWLPNQGVSTADFAKQLRVEQVETAKRVLIAGANC
jgi:acyl transferase domain-containing protein